VRYTVKVIKWADWISKWTNNAKKCVSLTVRRCGWSRADAEWRSGATCFSPGATDIVRLRERCIRGWLVPGLRHACALARFVRRPARETTPGHSLGITNCFVKISAFIAKTLLSRADHSLLNILTICERAHSKLKPLVHWENSFWVECTPKLEMQMPFTSTSECCVW
jgi:hypothetical protein